MMHDPAGFLLALEGNARQWRTPCGAGSLVWRGWGDGSPLVLLHGWAGSWRHWARNIASLGARYRLLVPDLPGMGESAPAPDGMTRPGLAAILGDGLKAIIGPDTAYDLVGFSFGGSLAALLALRDGALARRVTLVAPGGLPVPPGAGATVRVRGLDDAARLDAHRRNLGRLMFADPRNIDPLALLIQEENSRRIRQDKMAREPDVVQAAIRDMATVPSVIWGTRDNFSPGGIAGHVALLHHLRPQARIRCIEGAGHWVAYEAKEAFEAALLESLGASASLLLESAQARDDLD